uniref:Uncharacterized protein n=1 Tax=viral metagenome TaxID=1070528 RepID=A0A6C0CBC4_9ZZZZ
MSTTRFTSWITSNATLNLGYNTFLVDASEGNIVMTIPQNPGEGTSFTVTRVDATNNTVTISSIDSNINNIANPVSLGLHGNVLLRSSNGRWYSILGNWTQ